MRIPGGFGFVVPPDLKQAPADDFPLLACTFVHQKFPHRVPPGAMLLRAFFGGHEGEALLGEPDDRLIARARQQLSRVLGPLPEAVETVVRRWPRSLPQYAVGHLERMVELESLVEELMPIAIHFEEVAVRNFLSKDVSDLKAVLEEIYDSLKFLEPEIEEANAKRKAARPQA